jgi:predicted dehydrogenase
MAKKTVKLGIIGCGIAAQELHWPALSVLQDEFEVVSVCNHTPEKAQQLAQTIASAYGREIPYFLDYHKMLASPRVEAVAIILPVELNREVCTHAAKAGKHILVEKPLAESEEQASELLRLEELNQELVMMVAENFRYRPVFRELSNAVAEGAIGTPFFVEWRHWERIDPETNAFAKTSWRIHHRYEGGFVTDGGVHNIAALRDIFGELDSVGSFSASVNPRIGRTDTLAWLFRSSGREGIPPLAGILSLGFSVLGLDESRLTVLGDSGAIIVEGTVMNIHSLSSQPISVRDYPDDGGYIEEYRDFHRAITTGCRPRSTFSEAHADLQTILRALRDAVTSHP